jgi:hypothetical protein
VRPAAAGGGEQRIELSEHSLGLLAEAAAAGRAGRGIHRELARHEHEGASGDDRR